jgi:hypothetical protein
MRSHCQFFLINFVCLDPVCLLWFVSIYSFLISNDEVDKYLDETTDYLRGCHLKKQHLLRYRIDSITRLLKYIGGLNSRHLNSRHLNPGKFLINKQIEVSFSNGPVFRLQVHCLKMVPFWSGNQMIPSF